MKFHDLCVTFAADRLPQAVLQGCIARLEAMARLSAQGQRSTTNMEALQAQVRAGDCFLIADRSLSLGRLFIGERAFSELGILQFAGWPTDVAYPTTCKIILIDGGLVARAPWV